MSESDDSAGLAEQIAEAYMRIEANKSQDSDEESEENTELKEGEGTPESKESEVLSNEEPDKEMVTGEAESVAEDGNEEEEELSDVESAPDPPDEGVGRSPEVTESTDQVDQIQDELATFTAREGPFSFKIIPQSQKSGLSWAVWVFLRGAQGPVLQTTQTITDEQAGELGMSPTLQHRINEALRYAKTNLDLPNELKEKTQKRSLNDIEKIMRDK